LKGRRAKEARMTEIWEEDGDPWIVNGAARPFENAWLVLDRYEVAHPGGELGEYTVVRPRRIAVGVLPIEDDGGVHLVGQWRFPLGRYSWEMPEGGAEPGEPPLACARRELEEEAGLVASAYLPILEMDMSNSLSDERAVIYLATGLSAGAYQPEATEVLKHKRVHFQELLARVASGYVRDAMTVAAALRAYHMAMTGQLPQALARAMLDRGVR
jgi:8-oxo-dGTP pyrophosphatase MutT (NUDIX family)